MNPTNNYLILRYFVSCPFVTDSVNPVYELYYPCFAPGSRRKQDPRNRMLSVKEAHELIGRHHMHQAVANRYGNVWTMPGAETCAV